jgi:hypothetical protein
MIADIDFRDSAGEPHDAVGQNKKPRRGMTVRGNITTPQEE